MNYQQFYDDNQNYVRWFENVLKKEMLRVFPKLTTETVVLSGSRSFDLAYPESDLEFAVIQPVEQQDIAPFVLFFSQFGTPDVLKTLAGLQLLTLKSPRFPPYLQPPSCVRVWKLEMTLRTPEQQQTIETHIQNQLSTWSDDQKLHYIERIRKCFLDMTANPDNKVLAQTYNDCKVWLRALPIRKLE